MSKLVICPRLWEKPRGSSVESPRQKYFRIMWSLLLPTAALVALAVVCESLGGKWVVDPAGSVIDLALGYLVFSLLVMSTARRTDLTRQRRRVVERIVTATYQFLLCFKAVWLAVLCSDDLWPTRTSAGIVPMYAGVLLSFMGTFAVRGDVHRDNVRRSDDRRGYGAEYGDDEYRELPDESVEGSENDSEVRHATIRALLGFAAPDTLLLCAGFLFGSLAALGMALVPYLSGQVIDYASIDPDRRLFHLSIWKLLFVAVLTGIFTGLRGGIFTYATTKLTVRIRTKLFDNLMKQDVGFYDTSKSGDITSRLAADTTSVTDSVCLNLNIMMRSITQAAMVLVFMMRTSWRLTVVTITLVPCVIVR